MKFKKSIVAGTGTLAVLGAGMGTAFAVWNVQGSGSAGAAATVAQSLVVTAVTPSGSGASLYPGGPAAPVFLTIQNPNAFAVTVTGYTWGTPISLNTTACPTANLSIEAAAPTTASLSIAAGQTLTGTQVNGVLDMAHTAPNGCQGVSFSVPVTLTAAQQ